jgi:hypothetical protein
MWRRGVLAWLIVFALGAPAQAQTARDYLGEWRDTPIDRAPGRAVILHHIEITAVATLRPPARFSVRIWVRCMDDPAQACGLGAGEGVARTLSEGVEGIYVELNPARGGVTRPCLFNLLLAPGYDPAHPEHPDNHKGLDYRLTPPAGACAASPYSGIGGSGGKLSRTPPLVLRPAEPVAPPALARRRF